MTRLDSTDATSRHPRMSDRGVTLPMVAMMMVTLLGLAAFAVDLGWFYLNASRIQRAADASALAGVIHMPNDPIQASTVAHEIAQTNGYEDLEIPAVYPQVEAVAVPSQPTQLRVTVTEQVPTFFLKVFGMASQVITRTAQAEFVPPLPLGSPDNQFGNSCDPEMFAGCGPNFWANIHGRFTDTRYGDAFAAQCIGDSESPCPLNIMYRDDTSNRPGYLYGIEAQGAGSFTVEFLDVEFRNNSGLPQSDQIRTGDNGCVQWGDTQPNCGPIVQVTLWRPDATPLDLTDNLPPLCQQNVDPQPQIAPGDPYVFVRPAACFTVNGPSSGIYVLQVRSLGSGANPDGLNRYSVRSMPDTTRLYALGDMSIYNNSSGSTTDFHLAEVSSIYAGKTFVVELYDAGESAAPGTLQVIDPSGSVFNDGTCDIYTRTLVTDPWVLQSSPVDCQETVNPSEYHGRWLKFEMALPATYTCGPCWWKMNYAYTSDLQDTTTWRAYILGNPIHLVPVS